MMTASAFGQYWPPPPGVYRPFINDVVKGHYEDLSPTWETRGGVEMAELAYHGFATIGSGKPDTGYFALSGSSYDNSNEIYLMWPGSLITPDEVIPGHVNMFHFTYDCSGGISCIYDCSTPLIDTMICYDAIGFFWYNTDYDPNIWGPNDANDVVWTSIVIPWLSQPCPPGLPWYGKDDFYFANSIWEELPDTAILSGDSPLRLEVSFDTDPDSVVVNIWLRTKPDSLKRVAMQKVSGTHDWHGTYESARKLGLKSYNDVLAAITYPTSSRDMVHVALPRILTQVDSVFTDTVFLNSSEMKVAKDLKVTLRFTDDADTTQSIRAVNLVDTLGLGYKYKSLWIANENLSDTLKHKRYYHQFPRDSSSYLNWDKHADSCRVTFVRDSLYAIGGDLTIAAKGKLKPVANINNSFLVSTDTLNSNRRDTLQTKSILIDRDLPNSAFSDSLKRDRIRAIAWREWAGSNDCSHCCDPSNDPWNHYWDDRIWGIHWCVDTKRPCENRLGPETGIMQIRRFDKIQDTIHTWEKFFSRGGNTPNSYIVTRWDSLAWNWTIDIFNGKYIHDDYNSYKINKDNVQKIFPESCSYNDCNIFPSSKNKEDLKSYGYKWGEGAMSKIHTDRDWFIHISDSSSTEGIYVRDVREYTYEKPWLHP
jgi:hypothetical protein